MKNLKRSIISILVMLLLVVSAFIPSFAAETSEPASYSSSSNSGQRDVVCTTLDGTSAAAYYAGYEYDTLSNLSQDELKAELDELMTETHTYISDYDDCHYEANRTDCENGEGNVILIYTSYPATMSQWNGWNREHVWPKSLGGDNTTGGGADLHHIRPSDAGVNSSRGNKKYGNVNGGTEKYGTNPANGVLGGTYDNTYFEPLDNIKGDVARICLYVMVRWGNEWGATDITDVFESVDVLLEWCEMDPVDTWEMGRNEVVEDIQGNRNVFIDYPEYAWLIFGREVPDDMITPSGEAMGENVSSGTPTTPDTNTGDSILTTTQTTASVTISDYASSKGWANGTQYPSVVVDENITASASGSSNTGKYYTSGNEWRLYQSENATLTISAAEGCTISSIKITYNASNNGTLIYNDSEVVSSGSILEDVDSNSVTLAVGNTGSATNGQAKITKIEVTYLNEVEVPAPSCEHTNTTSATTQVTCTQDGSTTVTCDDCGVTISETVIPAVGHKYVDGTCSVCGDVLPTYTCTFITPTGTETVTVTGSAITLLDEPTVSLDAKYSFAGWGMSSIETPTTDAPTVYPAGESVSITDDTTFYAVYTYSEESTVETTVTKYSKYSGELTEGNYIITYSNGAMKATISSDRLSYTDITVSGNNVTSTISPDIVWTVSENGNYWTIYNSSTGKYAAGNGTKNKAALITNITDYAKWTVSGTSTYDFTNLGNSNKGVNATLRKNGTYGFACYATGTGGALTLYKETVTTETETASTTFYITTIPAEDLPDSCIHTSTTTTTVDATCTAAGSITVTCNTCHEVVSTETIPTLPHSYADGVCSVCGTPKPSDPLGLDGKKFYIATKRTSGNYFYMTSDLGTAGTKRYQAVDSGLAELPKFIAENLAEDSNVFVFEYNDVEKTYYIYALGVAEEEKYLGHTAGENNGILVTRENALKLTIGEVDGVYNIHYASSDGERYLSLNSTSGSNYFAFYRGTQTQDLSLIPVTEACKHTSTTTTTVDATCTEDGSITVTCDDCDEVLSTEVIEATGHNYVDSVCTACGHKKATETLGLDGKQFYIATIRSEGNYFYMTSDLGTASTERYQAVNSNLSVLPPFIASDLANDLYVFVFEFNSDDGTYCIYVAGISGDEKYLGHSSGNEGLLVAKEDALRLTVEAVDGAYNIHYTSGDGERYIALNNDSRYNYFAFYAGEQQKRNLHLIPLCECTHTSHVTTVVQNATCTEDGISVTVCADCKNFISSDTIAALGHDLIDGICSRCGYAESNTTPPDDPTESGWILVTDVSTLQPGDQIVIVATGYDYALGTTQNNNNRAQTAVTKDGNKVTFGDYVQIITLENGNISGTFAFNVGNGYLYAASSSSNYLRTKTTLDNNGSWSITITAAGVATIEAQGTNTRNWLRYNSGSSLFSCYSSGQTDVAIYKFEDGGNNSPAEDVSIYGASVTIGSNLALNYYVSGCLGTDYYMVFNMNGTESEHISGEYKNGYLVFSFKDIPPQCMADVITATLYDKDGNVLIEGFEFSLKEYATKVLEKYADKKDISDLVADMLRYGDAAQTYKNYNKGTILTDDIKTLIDGKGSNLSATDTDNARQLTTAEGTEIDKTLYTFTACGVRFDFDNKLYVKFKAVGDSDITFKLNGVTKYAEQLEDGTYVFYTTGINATDFDEVFTFELYVDGVLHQTITYSVNSYVYAKQGATDANGDPTALAELVLALYNYGISAKNYKS